MREPIRCEDRTELLYVEHARLEQDGYGVAMHAGGGTVPLPVSRLAAVLIGPGVSVTSAAVHVLARHGCAVCWTAEDGLTLRAVTLPADGGGRVLDQARLVLDPAAREAAARRMLERRLGRRLDPGLSLDALRGTEGLWMRELYARLSRETGVPWTGRATGDWDKADAVNQALSVANGSLYAVCHAAVAAAGCSPDLGIYHPGKPRGFVYDVADLYKHETTVPVAFEVAREGGGEDLRRRTRAACTAAFHRAGLFRRLVPDILEVLGDRHDREEGAPAPDG